MGEDKRAIYDLQRADPGLREAIRALNRENERRAQEQAARHKKTQRWLIVVAVLLVVQVGLRVAVEIMG